MTTITQLHISQIRNLIAVKIAPSTSFNVIVGANGSGKTSLLEAIYLLSMGRSFRTHLMSRVIHHDAEKAAVFAEISCQSSLGIERHRNGEMLIKIDGEKIKTLALLVERLPMQLLNPDSYRLLESGPKYRRQFLDWGLFHVEQTFYPLWQQYQLLLKQRNAVLRNNRYSNQIQCWNQSLAEVGEAISKLRQMYVAQLEPYVRQYVGQYLENFSSIAHLRIDYKSGWEPGLSLEAALLAHLNTERILGHTTQGPHRADLRLCIHKIPVQDVLSRGQQKLLVTALQLAQGKLLQEKTDKSCIYLIDDLPAELDANKRQLMMATLQDLGAQVFVTSLETELLDMLIASHGTSVFHVEHGRVK